jgi:hypothetical protein
MPIPRNRLTNMVRMSDRISESLPIETTQLPKIVPMPVSVIVPITMPTTAQARPTGSA